MAIKCLKKRVSGSLIGVKDHKEKNSKIKNGQL
jgi:hypothetical protein